MKEERIRKAREKEALMVPIVLTGGPEELSKYEKIRETKSFFNHTFPDLLLNIISSHFAVDICCILTEGL